MNYLLKIMGPICDNMMCITLLKIVDLSRQNKCMGTLTLRVEIILK